MKRAALVSSLLLLPAALVAQMPATATRALGLGGAYTSLARGYEAVTWNPAMLAARGRPSFTLSVPQVLVEVGSNTYDWQDFRDYANRTLNDADKQYLLDQISLDDTVLTIRTVGGVTPVGLSIGPLAFAVSSAGDMELSIGRDAVELALYGNASRTGPGEFFTARDSRGRGWAATTVAGSFALPFSLPQGRLAVGVTYKYVVGHFIGRAEELSSRLEVSPAFNANAAGHAIYTDYSGGYSASGLGDILGGQGKAGSGYGVDLGATIQFAGTSVTLSGVLVNAVSKMTWNEDRLVYERTRYQVVQDASGDVTNSRTDSTSYRTASQITADPVARVLRDSLLAHADFSRVARIGIALKSGPLSLSGDVHLRLSEGLDRNPAQFVAGGVEYRLLGFVPLRFGVGWDFGESFLLSAGTGLSLLGINIDVSAARLSGTLRPGVIGAVGFGLQY